MPAFWKNQHYPSLYASFACQRKLNSEDAGAEKRVKSVPERMLASLKNVDKCLETGLYNGNVNNPFISQQKQDEMTSLPNVVLQRYKLKTEIGHGAHGCIFEAVDMIKQIPVAVKLMDRECVRDKNKQKYEREVELMQATNEKNIIGYTQLYDYFSDANYYYVVMEKLDRNMRDLMLE